MPQLRNGKLVMMHGEEKGRSVGPPVPYTKGGGLFGGSRLPINRVGIFKSNWALPFEDMIDNTIGAGHNMLEDRYQRASGLPVRGIVPKRFAGRQCPQVPGTLCCPRKDLSGLGSLTTAGVGAAVTVGGLIVLAAVLLGGK